MVRLEVWIMKAVSPRLWLPVILSIIIFFIAPTDLSAQKTYTCKCEDVSDLLNLLNMDNAALDALDQYEKMINDTDETNEIPLSGNPAKLTKAGQLLQAIQQQMNWVKNKQARNANSETDSVTCEWKAEGETPCLKELMETRAVVDKAFCLAYKKKWAIGEKEDTMNKMLLKDYLTRQRELYQREIPRVLRILSSIPPSCLPGDWVGTVTVDENMTTTVTSPSSLGLSTTGSKTKSSVEQTSSSNYRFGVMWLKGDSATPLSSWSISGQITNTKKSEGTIFCKGGLAGASDEKGLKNDYKMEINKSGSRSLPNEVYLGEPEEDGKINLSFRIPNVEGKANGQTTDTRVSGCPGDSFSNVTPINQADYTLDSENIDFKAVYKKGDPKIKGDPEKIVGTETLNFFPFATSTPGFSNTHLVRVTYNLYKFSGGKK